MLQVKNRLLNKKDFEEVKKKGRKLQGPLFGVLVLAKREGLSRFGFIVSNRLSKKAHERNQIRRVLREAVRQDIRKIRGGFDVVFLAKREILDKKTQEIRKETEEILKTAGLLNG